MPAPLICLHVHSHTRHHFTPVRPAHVRTHTHINQLGWHVAHTHLYASVSSFLGTGESCATLETGSRGAFAASALSKARYAIQHATHISKYKVSFISASEKDRRCGLLLKILLGSAQTVFFFFCELTHPSPFLFLSS